MAKFKKYMLGFVRYLRRTYRNKLLALALVLVGLVPALLDGDGTSLVFMLMLAVPVFFMDRDVMVPNKD